jgi:hypothetical protein
MLTEVISVREDDHGVGHGSCGGELVGAPGIAPARELIEATVSPTLPSALCPPAQQSQWLFRPEPLTPMFRPAQSRTVAVPCQDVINFAGDAIYQKMIYAACLVLCTMLAAGAASWEREFAGGCHPMRRPRKGATPWGRTSSRPRTLMLPGSRSR